MDSAFCNCCTLNNLSMQCVAVQNIPLLKRGLAEFQKLAKTAVVHQAECLEGSDYCNACTKRLLLLTSSSQMISSTRWFINPAFVNIGFLRSQVIMPLRDV